MESFLSKISRIAVLISSMVPLLLVSNMVFAGVRAVPEPGPFNLLILGGVALFIARFIHRKK